MDGVSGVDVSWLHHNAAQKDQRKATSKPSSKQSSKASSRAASPPPAPPSPLAASKAQFIPDRILDSALPKDAPQPSSASAPIPIISGPASQGPTAQKRGGILQRGSSERLSGSSVGSSPEETRSSSRPAWIRSLSSKFSSGDKTATQSSQGSVPTAQGAPAAPKSPQSFMPPPPDRSVSASEHDPYVPQQPKAGGSFFSSALRRLSSSTPQGTPSKPTAQGTASPRQLLNIDKHRQRCQVQDLQEGRLRRVAFSVDVEVAGVSRYLEESDPVDPMNKDKDKRLQARSEGDTLKNPKLSVEQKETNEMKETASSIVHGAPEARQASVGSVDDMLEKEMLAAAKRLEKQQSAARKRQAKEEKRRSNTQDGEIADTGSQPDAQESKPIRLDLDRRPPASYAEDRPTTDPLRIYRRCCQLREAPVLKRISEQLANMKQEVEKTGFVPFLDLNASRLQLPDVGCLGDWLAIVPVKKLSMDNANLTDEGLRIILAGLLATRSPNAFKHRPTSSSPSRRREQKERKSHGVIEKLSLRSNYKITVEGWKSICVFLNLSPSLRAIDLSLIPFPHLGGSELQPEMSTTDFAPLDMANILGEAITSRPDGFSQIEELIVSECRLTAHDVGKIVDAACKSNVNKLGLAKNNLNSEGVEHVKRFLASKNCGGLDLGGNDLRKGLLSLVKAIGRDCPLWALCLADCNLTPSAIAHLLPALTPLPEFRVLVLSHNKGLFSGTPDSVGLLRKYLPLCKRLRRLDLTDTTLSPNQAIGIADILPEVRNLNHLGLGENADIRKLATASDATSQEEACALYGSLMVAARLSKTLLAVDIDVPSKDTSEIVQALAKQIVAYAFRNVERYAAFDAIYSQDPASLIPDEIEDGKDVPVPDVLAHLLGNVGDDHDQPHVLDVQRDQDYIMGGTGVVKALSYVLGQKTSDGRRLSGNFSGSSSPTHPGTPNAPASEDLRAREMSKNLLSSARKIRTRLQLTMAQKGDSSDELSFRRLQFLDHTLQGMIQRFEDAYPDCAVSTQQAPLQYPFRAHPEAMPESQAPVTWKEADGAEAIDTEPDAISVRSRTSSTASSLPSGGSAASVLTGLASTSTGPEPSPALDGVSRRGSTADVVAKAQANEEGRMHRFGQRFRREILPPKGSDDHYHRTSKADPAEEPHLAQLRSRLEAMEGQELREKVIRDGLENTVREYSEEAERLRREIIPVFGKIDLAEATPKEGRIQEALRNLEGSGD